MTWSPEIWPKAPVPKEFADCHQCELAKQRTRVIWGEGNPNAPIFVILDNPGAREDKFGKAFVCGTRQTLIAAVNDAGLGMNDIYLTYVLHCRPMRKYDKEQARSICMEHLRRQMKEKDPSLIVCLGNVAAQAYLNNPEAEIKSLRGAVIDHAGKATAFSYHPLAVRRRPVLHRQFTEDWRLIASFVRGNQKRLKPGR